MTVGGLLAALAMLSVVAPVSSRAQDAAEAAKGPPLTISVLVRSRTTDCHDRGFTRAITQLAAGEQVRINRLGGISGRPLEVIIREDDARDRGQLAANIKAALGDPNSIGIVGLINSNDGEAVFGELGGAIKASGIPFVSGLSVDRVFKDLPNVFTFRPSQDTARLPVMVEFMRQTGISSVAFAGLDASAFSRSLGDGLKRELGARAVVAEHYMAADDDGVDRDAVKALIGDLQARRPQMLALTVGTRRTGAVLKAMMDAAVTPAIFMTGRIEDLADDVTAAYPNAIYQLSWDSPPESFNDRLRRRIARDAPEAWVFGGEKNDAAPGWATGACKEREAVDEPDPLSDDNLRAIGIGTQFADMVALISAAANTAPRDAGLEARRAHVVGELKTTFAAGRGAFQGTFDTWSFEPASRGAVRTPFVVILPQGLGRTQLAPIQFVRLRDGSLRKIDTLYVDVDMIKAHRIDDNEKTFLAEFYLSMRDNAGASIDNIEFTNAYLDPSSGGQQLSIQPVHEGGDDKAYPAAMKIYRVSGRFLFEPALAAYPFDTQRFAIDLQPKQGKASFIVQAPPKAIRDVGVATDGWDAKEAYVGYDADFLPMVDAYTHQPSVVPFYKASFVWLMKRQTTDYYLRVVVPLTFILIVAYLSIFIPSSHFEAIITIQVTALLSAVALYLSLTQLDTDTATLSDRIFVFNYMMVSLMIVISILRINPAIATRRRLKAALTLAHVTLIPMLVAAMAAYIYGVSSAS